MSQSENTSRVWNQIAESRQRGVCLVMGIVNVTPDSFSDGGQFIQEAHAVEHALQLISDGADILDIGGESTRPGSQPVGEEEELRRVLPVIQAIRKTSAIPISVDTRKAVVAAAALDEGANIINDISGLRDDPALVDVVRQYDCPVVIMHMQGTPETMQNDPQYNDVLEEVSCFFEERIAYCRDNSIERIILDPGIGFGKRLEDNLQLIREMDTFSTFRFPVLLGASRKGFIGTVTGQSVERRLGGSIAVALAGARNGAAIVRVHDVLDTVSALAVSAALAAKGEKYHAL